MRTIKDRCKKMRLAFLSIIKFSKTVGKYATKHVFIAFFREPTGFEILSKVFETEISKNTTIVRKKMQNQERPGINPIF